MKVFCQLVNPKAGPSHGWEKDLRDRWVMQSVWDGLVQHSQLVRKLRGLIGLGLSTSVAQLKRVGRHGGSS